ncbi:Os07g0181200, partial [Oryza sativa Japonica Group]
LIVGEPMGILGENLCKLVWYVAGAQRRLRRPPGARPTEHTAARVVLAESLDGEDNQLMVNSYHCTTREGVQAAAGGAVRADGVRSALRMRFCRRGAGLPPPPRPSPRRSSGCCRSPQRCARPMRGQE